MSIWMAATLMLLASLLFVVLTMRGAAEESGAHTPRPRYFWVAMLLVVIASVLLYRQLGANRELALRDNIEALFEAASENPEAAHQSAMELVDELEQATVLYPEKIVYWNLLANQRVSLEQHREAANAFAQAYRLSPDDISLLARQAEAIYVASGYQLNDEVRVLVDQVLAVEENNPIVMNVIAATAYRGGRADLAMQFWERALSVMPPRSPEAANRRATIAAAKRQVAATRNPSDRPADSSIPESGESLTLDLAVSLNEGLSFPPETTVFVFVRQAGGPPMPIVVERTTVGQLPSVFQMDDSKVMIPGRSLRDFPALELVARVSLSGQPVPQAGDYEVVVGPVSAAEVQGEIALKIADPVR